MDRCREQTCVTCYACPKIQAIPRPARMPDRMAAKLPLVEARLQIFALTARGRLLRKRGNRAKPTVATSSHFAQQVVAGNDGNGVSSSV